MLGLKKLSLSSVNDLTRNIWLAGLGAYGKSTDYAVDKFDKTYEEANAQFQSLLAKGSEVQEKLDEKLKVRQEFEGRVDEVRKKLGLDDKEIAPQLVELEARIDKLTDVVAALAEKRLAALEANVKQTTETNAAAQTDVTADVSAEAETANAEVAEVASVEAETVEAKPTTRRSRRSRPVNK